MKDEMNFDDLEKLLQDEANNQKMFPSDYVWNNIAKQIQPKKSWPALTIISSVIVLALGVATFYNYPPENILDSIRIATGKHNLNNTITNVQKAPQKSTISSVERPINLTTKFIPSAVIRQISTNKLIQGNSNLLASLSSIIPVETTRKEELDNDGYQTVASLKEKKPFLLGEFESVDNWSNIDYPKLDNIKLPNLQDHKKAKATKEILRKLEYEVYTTPSISYRSLAQDQVGSRYSSSSVNNQVSQKAGLGTELGLGLRYQVSKDITLKTGVQFNIRQYYIDAYQSSGLATIDVFQNNKLDSINVASKYSNGSGLIDTKLTNRLYQVSIPIGLEWKVLETKHIGFNLGVSIQPTYSLNKNVFIISTDYKYYASGESLFRKWNINSSINANFTYTHNKSTFFIGPQVRYQHLPTYVDKYPIKEYRVDYGVRLGIIRLLGK